MDRREFLAVPALAFLAGVSYAYPNPRRRPAEAERHRIRRPLLVRTRKGRVEYVVPVDLAIGWELQHAARVVLVRELHVSGPDGTQIEVATVSLPDGEIDRFPITRETTDENRTNLPGSLIGPDDPHAPAIEDGAHSCAWERA